MWSMELHSRSRERCGDEIYLRANRIQTGSLKGHKTGMDCKYSYTPGGPAGRVLNSFNWTTGTIDGSVKIDQEPPQILKIGQAAVGDSGRIQMVDIRLAGVFHKGL